MPGILAVVLPQKGILNSSSYELMSAGRDLAGKSGEPFWAAVISDQASALAQELVERGADKVFVLEHPSFANLLDDSFAASLAALAGAEKPSKILFASTVAGRSIAARLSVLLKAGVAAEVSEFLSAGAGSLKARRTWYSGNLFAEVEIKSPTAVAIIQGLAWPQAERQSGRTGEIVKAAVAPAPSRIEFSSFQAEESNEIDLATAERVVSGGRGLGSAEGFKVIRELAHAIKAAVGASRAVVDSGWIAYRHQVGLTGRAVRPKLYIAAGISGQIQHLAGMSASPNIVAINTDPDCPMMKVASISVVGDLLELLPLVTEEIKKRKGVPVAA